MVPLDADVPACRDARGGAWTARGGRDADGRYLDTARHICGDAFEPKAGGLIAGWILAPNHARRF